MSVNEPLTVPPSISGTPGFLRPLKTMAVQAIQQAFVLTYPETDPVGGQQPVYCSLEYPVAAASYPALWVNYVPAMLQTAGISYTENDEFGNYYTRWRFSGTVEFTCAALTNNERDMLYDQLVSVLGFASQSNVPSAFRSFIEGSPLIESTWSFDTLDSSGHSDAPGTPWGTDEVIYEDTVSVQVIGEFTSDPVTLELVDLSAITVTAVPVETLQGPVLPGGWTITIDEDQVLSPGG
jgi:hypothetical protein